MFAQFARWIQPQPDRVQAHAVYIALVEQARQPFFYEALAVADTLDGRFDLICLHVFLFTHRMKQEEGGHAFANTVIDIMFDDMDRSLREIGVGDMSVGKKVKKMAHAWNGRMTVYGNVLGDYAELTKALAHNVYRQEDEQIPHAARLADYVGLAVERLQTQSIEELKQARISWPQPSN